MHVQLGPATPTSTGANIGKPLEGVRILDLTRVLAGPFATMNLGDLGGEVIKVEKPGTGDDTRSWGPPFLGNESIYFLSVNRNKKSIAVDLKNPKGVKIIKELSAVSDVFVENYIPGKLAAMGLGYEDINKIAPQIVYCSITVLLCAALSPIVERTPTNKDVAKECLVERISLNNEKQRKRTKKMEQVVNQEEKAFIAERAGEKVMPLV
ncbi:hypothetical protein JD844_002618 [Phrynosoma platyrhinos]|uniref:Uncharacterized protein n=1 Tax=Phrynosoma platyrhinos TaxID=52577 RepID=A0ABQ7TBY1_PHRPL|nr:hypothetical protein JD844_002618 [Phrynosoma platyrhinos]